MFTLGVDYGANSMRALVVRCADGAEFGSAVVGYPSGDEGVLLDESDHRLARQAPAGLPGDLRLPIDSPSAHAAP
jgi:L-ribulokinase